MEENRISRLRPAQVIERMARSPVVYIPIGPIEWHGPHLPFGVDPLNAEDVSIRTCAVTGGMVWPTLFWGTERERRPEQLEALGLPRESYVVGMDFPANSLPSAYCPEEIFGLVVRELLREVRLMGARVAVIVNGHGAVNHNQVLRRLAAESNQASGLRVHVRMAMPMDEVERGAIGHATSTETSIMMNIDRSSVAVDALPAFPTPLRFEEFGIVDGLGFDGKGDPGRVVQEDPRTLSSPEAGREVSERTVRELAEQVRGILGAL